MDTTVMIDLGDLSSHQASRFVITIRSPSLDQSHSMVLYRVQQSGAWQHDDTTTWHAMEEECPHLGASMAEAELDIEDGEMVAICPWHKFVCLFLVIQHFSAVYHTVLQKMFDMNRLKKAFYFYLVVAVYAAARIYFVEIVHHVFLSYDFNLRTGESSTGLQTCIYPVHVKQNRINMGCPVNAMDWELVSIRPVSQNSASLPEPAPYLQLKDDELPTTVTGWGRLILETSNPYLKVSRTQHAISLFRQGHLPDLGDSLPPSHDPPRENLCIVQPGQMKSRGKGKSLESRIKLLHALANIEQWAIDLAWDIIVRFCQTGLGFGNGEKLPMSFVADFLKVAEDEAKHFTLLREALVRLGSDWGKLPSHNGLWQSAKDTSHSLVSRLCIIHLVHEARGLDVNPTQIKRVRDAGDFATAASLEVIHADEITHVATGHRWLVYIASHSNPPLDPVQVFRNEVKTHFFGQLKEPFNVEDRAKAGLDPAYYTNLAGK